MPSPLVKSPPCSVKCGMTLGLGLGLGVGVGLANPSPNPSPHLQHEVWDDAVELAALVAEAARASAPGGRQLKAGW